MVASDATLFVFVLCPLNIVPIKANDGGVSGAGELCGWPEAGSADPMEVSSGQQKCADCKTLIRISPWSLIKDPRPQYTAVSNLKCEVRP